jgi:LysR family transcriptional regulator, low CO2-responsive transcriptional regulator
MNLDQLAAFDRIVREGSFSRAALRLGIGQPAISARLQVLELEVGGALFTRGRRVALTALGESFLPYARRALDVLGEGVEAARQAQTGGRGRVRLGTLGSLADGLVGPALASFLKRHPRVDCTVRTGDHERVVSQLLDGVVELGVVAWPCTEAGTGDLAALFELHEPVVPVVGPRHPLAARRRVSQDELARQASPLFRLRWWPTHHPALLRLAERAGPSLELSMEVARRLALQDVGAGFFTRTFVAEDLARGALVQLHVSDLEPVFRESALVRRRRGAPLSPAAAGLVEALRGEAAQLELLRPARRGGGGRRRR